MIGIIGGCVSGAATKVGHIARVGAEEGGGESEPGSQRRWVPPRVFFRMSGK